MQHVKIDLLESELSNFDDISITETWFTHNKTSSNINLNGFRTPLDRTGDGHGVVAVYVKNEISCKRRHDLETVALECVWLEFVCIVNGFCWYILSNAKF